METLKGSDFLSGPGNDMTQEELEAEGEWPEKTLEDLEADDFLGA